MTRPTFLKLLAVAALALLAVAPTSAAAAKQQKATFRIVIEGVGRYDPIDFPDYEWDFRSWGAIKDSGPLGATGQGWMELWGQQATYVVFFDEGGTFELWQPADGTWPGTLLGTGTHTGTTTTNGWTIRHRFELEGTLVDG